MNMKKLMIFLKIIALLLCIANFVIAYDNGNNSAFYGWLTSFFWVLSSIFSDLN